MLKSKEGPKSQDLWLSKLALTAVVEHQSAVPAGLGKIQAQAAVGRVTEKGGAQDHRPAAMPSQGFL